ncbi:glutamyl-tRNA reductase [Riemerella anatipestifer]|uniref:glutamyl-tRNA reductase n=1 Tax=Riemerella anatipestifer TaxID=34085 RepID=UPI0012ADE417|nr:glutamyl-tRNA reductase [Riemerella anatipestifer]MCO7319305.1 glutamyl-tRNA reductase [Riemerella anatipestifer]MCQ4155586.1 glutamyl-tRNA reductase [Riemerella anatipestifer]MCQ4181533.1 glutamyl-tRNA reductase [Riemerella anatipestifer]MCW0474812.1 glutamyl-tRNA reductase [Riemerella anatipestifer]MDR7775654.1 glutamyl-tRNA reductase [Riemerella anatipestifer]
MHFPNSSYKTAHFTVLSISFEKADTETRGRFAFFDEHIQDFVNKIHEKNMGDAFVVSTCNRTEIYTTSHNYMFVAQLFCDIVGVDLVEFIKYCDVKKGEDALNHLFRVAAGLESQILGDFEIISQIKKAYSRFKTYKRTTNSYMERAINYAIQISKKIKNQTGISNGAASVSYAAVHYILNHKTQLQDKNILLLGIGEIGQNTVENLMKHLYRPKVKIANRTLENAKIVADKFGIPYTDFSNVKEEISNTDILIVATGASKPIINREDLPEGKEMLVIDLAIPHNVDKSVEELPLVELIDVDKLSEKIQETLGIRKKEIPKAERIIKEMGKEFLEWEKKRKYTPNILHFKSSLKKIEENEMHHFYRKHKYIGIEDMELSNKIIQKITNRFAKFIIDNPMKAEEISKLMNDIFVQQPIDEFNEKHH